MKKRILVVDDDELGCRGVCRLLERQGYDCTGAHSATEALPVLESTVFDLVIADINMEGNTRLEFIHKVRNRETPVPIILITGHPTIETAVAATSLDISAYLLKPLNPERLFEVVREEFQRQTVFSALREHRIKQENALRLMQDMESAFIHANGGGAPAALQSYLRLTFEQSIDSLLDLKALMESLIKQNPGSSTSTQLSTARPLVLVNAIQETIQVLEHTRTSFKSKELAALRLKLEALLKTSACPS